MITRRMMPLLGMWATMLSHVPAAATYEVDVAHTTIGFTVEHMVISRVRGAFREFEGVMEYDEAAPTNLTVRGRIQVASIDTGNARRDAHLRGADFFDAEKYPTILFESKRTEVEFGRITLVGDLTMRGVTREIRLPLTITGPITDPWGNVRLGIETGVVLNRKDFGIQWSQLMDNGGLVVGDEVTVEISAEVVQKP